MQQLVNRISVDTSILPNHVTVMTWFAFLLNQCARPYQSAVIDEVGYIRGLNFIGERPRHVSKSKPKSYYLDSHRDMFRDGVAAFAFEANRMSDGKVVNRPPQCTTISMWMKCRTWRTMTSMSWSFL